MLPKYQDKLLAWPFSKKMIGEITGNSHNWTVEIGVLFM